MATVEETEKLSKDVVILFKDNEFAEAFDLLESYWPLPKNEIENLEEKTIVMMNTIRNRFGKVIDYVRVKKEIIGDVATRETYLLCFENTAIRMIFTYYRNLDGWILNAFKWDDSFTDEFITVEE
ncbi:MAG: hypothetical protein JNJ99_14350 [Crocinitomicaceae bacterium]|nr:hypothetical protein [Crocinitomicaceae bacterium]